MTLALLVTAATGAWADDVLNLVVDGTSATIMYDDNPNSNPYLGETGWKQNGGPWFTSSTIKPTITTVTIDGSCKNFSGTSLQNLFSSCSGLTTINGLDNLNTANVQNMQYMFYGCSSLTSLDLSSLNTASVTTMYLVFKGCSKLTSLDLSSWNTENVVNTASLFQGCSELTTVDLSGWNTAKVQNMSFMFDNCSKLENIYVGDGWSTAAVTNGSNMFDGCSKLPNWNGTVTHAMAKLTDDGGYLQKKPEPLELTWNAATKTATLAEMPEGNVTVNVEYMSVAGVTLNVSGTGGTAQLLDTTFVAWAAENKLMEGKRFVLYVEMDEGYDFSTSFSKGGDSKKFMTPFTKEEYRAYVQYAKENGIQIPANAVMKWVTMPDTGDETLTLGLTFAKQKTYTVMFEPMAAATEMWCRFAVMQNGEETYGYAQMARNSTFGGKTVWSMKLLSAFDPTKVSFHNSEEAAASGGTMDVVNQLNNWIDGSDGKIYIAGNNATTVVAAFVADASSVPLYNSETANFDFNRENRGVTYQLVVCSVNNGNVQASSITLPAAPAAPQGKQFGGWSVLTGTAPDKMLQTYDPNDTYDIKENTTFSAVWKPVQVTTTFALNGGTGASSTVTRNYGLTLGNIEEPTRRGFAFDKWTVAKAVTESGKFFGKGSAFDLSTELTANLNLSAQWKHVHEYISYPISAFGDALAAYQKYNGALHIAICGCSDVDIVAHEFSKAGKCACGYVKPGAQPVTLEPMYGKLNGTSFQTFALGFPEEVKRGEEVTVDAPHNWGNLEFKTWEYSTDGGTTWSELAAFETVGFLIPCNMKVRALYVNPVQKATVELSSSEYLEPVEYLGQTYKMGNILFQMNYQLPDGYTFVDAGIRMGDNDGISYYEQKERNYSYDAEAKAIAASMLVAVSFLNGEPTTADMSATEKYWANRENSVLDEFSAEKLAKYMMESKPVNVEKYEPIYWQTAAQTKGLSGSMATLPPTRFAQKNNQDHYIYGVGYLRYKTPGGLTETIYTDAIAATVNHPDGYQKAEEALNARRKAPKRESAQQDELLDLSYITTPETQLTVMVDGSYSAQLSDAYGYGEKVTVKAPSVAGKTFSYWAADGTVISTDKELTLTMKANTKLQAVYNAASVPDMPAAAIVSATRSNNGESIVLQCKANGTFETAGLVYSTTATGEDLTVNNDDVTKVETVKYSALPTNGQQIDFVALDKNNCWTMQITPDDDQTVYHVRPYTINGMAVNYGEEKDVKLSRLKNGVMMVANIEAFDHSAEPGIDSLLTKLQKEGRLVAGYPVIVDAGGYATYYKDATLKLSESSVDNAALYTITSVTDTTAVLSSKIDVAAAHTPLLVKNNSDDTMTVLLMPTDDDADDVTVYDGFKGVLNDSTFTAEGMEGLEFYVCNGFDFVWVKDAGTIPANKCWLQIPVESEQAGQQQEQLNVRRIVFPSETTGISEELRVKSEEFAPATIYDLQGRRVNGQSSMVNGQLKKGVYILNGKKVVK